MSKEDIKTHEFEKGKSGNPNGRPKGSRNVTTQLVALLKKDAPDLFVDSQAARSLCSHLKRITNSDAVAARLLFRALGGDMKAIREVFDRTEGRSRQAVELSGAAGSPVEVLYRIVYEDTPIRK